MEPLNFRAFQPKVLPDSWLKFAVMVSICENSFLFCRHSKRTSWEFPGGHREAGELIEDTAKRELFEETGASRFTITHLCDYSYNLADEVVLDFANPPEVKFGALFFAHIFERGPIPGFEIAETKLFETAPVELTYAKTYAQIFAYLKKFPEIFPQGVKL